jgi:hypothetical protein
MSMIASDYPNRESFQAANNARRRALSALQTLEENAGALRERIENGYAPYGTDALRFSHSATQAAAEMAIMETLRDMLEWHAADKAEEKKKT